MTLENEIGVTPSTYLKENPFHEINEQKIINAYICDMMKEFQNNFDGSKSNSEKVDTAASETSKDLAGMNSVETNTIITSLNEQMRSQARSSSNFMFLLVKNQNNVVEKVIKTSLSEEKRLGEVLEGYMEDAYFVKIDGVCDVYEWNGLKDVQVYDIPALFGESKKLTLRKYRKGAF